MTQNEEFRISDIVVVTFSMTDILNRELHQTCDCKWCCLFWRANCGI